MYVHIYVRNTFSQVQSHLCSQASYISSSVLHIYICTDIRNIISMFVKVETNTPTDPLV